MTFKQWMAKVDGEISRQVEMDTAQALTRELWCLQEGDRL